MENKALICDAINGNEKAFEELVKKESSKLYRTAFLYVGNKEDALDIVQETVYQAFKSINSLRNPQYFSTWLVKILIRNTYRVLEKNKNLTTVRDEFLANVQDEKITEIHQSMDLAEALKLLHEKQRTAIILFYYHDLPIHIIARMMDKPDGTVKSYLRRAKMELKKILEGEQFYEKKYI